MGKKYTKALFVLICLFVGIGLALPAEAAPIKIYVNQQEIKSDVPPSIVDGRTLLPVRAISEALGADVKWDQESQTANISKDNLSLVLPYKSNIYFLNAQARTLDVGVHMIHNRIMVPARVVSESFGYRVEWNNDTRTVYIDHASEIKKEPTQTEVEQASGNNAVKIENVTGRVQVKTTAAAMFDTPSTAGQILHEAKIKDYFDTNGKSGQWYRVLLPNGKEAWIPEWLVQFEPSGSAASSNNNQNVNQSPVEKPSPNVEESASAKYIEVVYPVVNVRAQANTQSDIVGTVTTGDKFEVVSFVDGWYQVKYQDGKNRWIFGDLVKKISASAYTSNSNETKAPTPSVPLRVTKIQEEYGQTYITFDVGDAEVNEVENSGNTISVDINGVTLGSISENPVAGKAPFTKMALVQTSPQKVTLTATVEDGGYFRLDRKNRNFSVMAVRKNKNGQLGLQGKTIVISAGHGNYINGRVDPGAIGKSGLSEVDFNTPVAMKLRDKLEKNGAKVIMVREYAPVHTTLYERAALANDNSADAFVSIHGDSAPQNPSARGIGIFKYDGDLRLTSAAQRDMRTAFANTMQAAMLEATGARTYVRDGNFAVLRENEVPSVLIECGFLSNPQDEALLASDAYQEKLAQGMFDGLKKWFS